MIRNARAPPISTKETATLIELLCYWCSKEAIERFLLDRYFRTLFLLVANDIKMDGKAFCEGRGKRILSRALALKESQAFTDRVDQLVNYAHFLSLL